MQISSSSPFVLPVLLLIAAAPLLLATGASSEINNNYSDCQQKCGGVDVPYPFGIGDGCFRKGFEIICDNKASGGGAVKPRLPTTNDSRYTIDVLTLSVTPRPEATVMLPVTSQCYDSAGSSNGSKSSGYYDFNSKGAYRISNTRNEFFVLGCNTLAYTKNGRGQGNRFDYAYYTGCVAYVNDSSSARDGACDSIGCCHVEIPPDLTDNTITIVVDNGTWSRRNQQGFCPCDYAFIVETGNYTFAASDLTTMPLHRTMPLVLDGAIRDFSSCAMAVNKPEYACRSNHSQCFDSDNGPGYICNCTQGYEGNPYLQEDGECTNINECQRSRDEYPCHGECHDTDGSYDCVCPSGYENKGDPKDTPCTQKFPLAAKITLGTVLATSALVFLLLSVVIMLQKRQLFRKNGGNILKNVNSLIFFTKKEVKKITRNYRDFIGKGAFGEVYKGILRDKDRTTVAVKRSATAVVEKEEFAKEVEIQARMIHKNVLRLKGCCLEVKRPMLVYEYAANGNLGDMIHGKVGQNKRPFPLEQRLDIAIGSAEGLTYMHTYIDSIIQHGDIKPDNILLDEEFVPKVADFGLSSLLDSPKEYVSFVRGSNGYMDPAFAGTGRLTLANDVYSFGVVLLELITRKSIEPCQLKKGQPYEECGLVTDFRRVYEKDNSTCEKGNNINKLLDKDIATKEALPLLEGIVRLAMECLGKNRPNMTEVARRLAMLKKEMKQGKRSSQVTSRSDETMLVLPTTECAFPLGLAKLESDKTRLLRS